MFKKYFIPEEENDYQPHFLRTRVVTVFLIFLFLIEAAFLVQILFLWRYTNIFSSILPSVLVELTNGDRGQNRIAALAVNPLLEQAAQLKAQDMAQKSYFAHTSPSGLTPWVWLQKVGYKYSGAGENLAVNFSDSSDIESAWMNSPTHRANILDNRFSEIGIATAKGIYQDRESIFVVQFFGRPLGQKVQKPVALETPVPSPSQSSLILPSPSASPSESVAVSPSPSIFLSPSPSVSTSSPNATTSPNFNATTSPLESENMAIANQEEIATSGPVEGASINMEPEATISQTSWLKKFLSMPKTVTNLLYLIIATIFSLALVLKIFVKIKIQYPKLIFNGVALLFVIISLLYMNILIVGKGESPSPQIIWLVEAPGI